MTKDELLRVREHAAKLLGRIEGVAGPGGNALSTLSVHAADWSIGARALLEEIHHSLRTNAPFPPGLYERLERTLA